MRILRNTIFLLNFPAELLPRKGFYRAKPNIRWSMRIKRRLLHRILEVVADLAGNMAGLRFLIFIG